MNAPLSFPVPIPDAATVASIAPMLGDEEREHLRARARELLDKQDAVLVAHKDSAEEVKQVVDWLRERGRCEGRTHRRVYRPWGHYEGLDSGDRFQVKRLTVKPGASLSLQMHHHRAEHWVVVRGTARVFRYD